MRKEYGLRMNCCVCRMEGSVENTADAVFLHKPIQVRADYLLLSEGK